MARGPLFYYTLQDILLELDPFAFRTGDRWMDLLRKITLAVGARCSCSPDSEFGLLREWLAAIGGACKCNDSIWSLYSRILTQVRLNFGNPNTPFFEFRAGDSLLDILRKILNNLQNAEPPIPSECCLPVGDWGSITLPPTVICDWGSIAAIATCTEDWGNI